MNKFVGCDPAILREVLREAGLRPRETGKSYVFDCPRCRKKNKLYLRKADGRFVCWSCSATENYQGRPEFALADLLGIPLKEVSARLYGYAANIHVDLYLDLRLVDFFDDDDELDEEAVEISTVDWPFDFYDIDAPEAARGAEYLAGRGIPIETAKRYGVHYHPMEKRVAFPVESHGRLYGWQGRLVIPEEYIDEQGNERKMLKIRSSTGIPRERTLMFADRLTDSDHALIGEGPVDAMKADLVGGNVSSMGKKVTRAQMMLILNSGVKKCYLGLDPDAATETQKLVRDYFDDLKLYQLAIKVGGAKVKADLGAMKPSEVLDLARGAERIPAGRLFVYFEPKVAR